MSRRLTLETVVCNVCLRSRTLTTPLQTEKDLHYGYRKPRSGVRTTWSLFREHSTLNRKRKTQSSPKLIPLKSMSGNHHTRLQSLVCVVLQTGVIRASPRPSPRTSTLETSGALDTGAPDGDDEGDGNDTDG